MRYPFNKYGWTNFIWWFKYRLQKKYKYHKIYLNLKPGFYEYQDIIEKCIASPRFFWLFEHQYEEYKKLIKEQDSDNEIYTVEFDQVIKELKKAYLWFKKYKARFEKLREKEIQFLSDFWNGSYMQRLSGQSTPEQIAALLKYDRLGSFIYGTSTHYLGIIVKHRMFLDT